MSDVESLISGVREAVMALKHCIPDEHEIPDAAGYVREFEVTLAEWRRTQEKRFDEMQPLKHPEPTERIKDSGFTGTPVAQGQQYELVPTYKTDRSYNTPRLLVAFQDAITEKMGLEFDLNQTIVMLTAADAIKLSWKWTQLKKAARQYGVKLDIGDHEVDESAGMDEPMIGEIRKRTGYQRVAIKQEDA